MSVASKNPYDLLGNDDPDSDAPSGPVKTVDKQSTRTTKRSAEPEAPKTSAPVPNRRGGGFSGSEAAFRDRGAGQDRNRGKSTEESARGGPRGGYSARGRGSRGGRFPRDRDDRHSKGLPSSSDRTAAQTADTEGQAELNDEQAGEALAQTEQKEDAGEAAAEAAKDEEPAEPEDKSISYSEYLAQQAEKKLALDATALAARKPNEGSKLNKKWETAKPLVKEEDDAFMVGSGAKAKRERERKTKQLVELDNRYIEPDRPVRGGRGGGPRGGRGSTRGDARGGSRGDARGGARGAPSFSRGRGGRDAGSAGGATGLNPNDQSAFPSLGS